MRSPGSCFVLIGLLLISFPCVAEDPYIVGAHYYAWYGGTVNPHWPDGVAHRPWIGYYSSASPDAVRQQIDVATQHGIDVFAVGWTGPDRPPEINFKAGFLKAPNLSRIRFCMVYDSNIRLKGDRASSRDFDFDDPGIRRTFIADMIYLARRYFSHPSYFKINGRPVLKLYLTRRYSGEFPAALKEVRNEWKKMGMNPYLIGDSLFYGRNDLYLISQFDAVTIYNLHSPSLFEQGIDTTGELAASARPFFWNFLYQIKDLTVVSARSPVHFQPGVIPQYDARVARGNKTAILAGSKDEVKQMFQVARDILDSSTAAPKVVWITSWNEWHEGTAIEPTENTGPKYPGGNFGFDFVEAVSEVFQ